MQTANENEQLTHQQYEDIQVDTNNCCNPSFRSIKSSHSIENTRNSQKSLKNSKERGIQLTHKTKSFTSINHTIKLVSKQSEPVRLNQKMSKKNQQSHLSSNALSNLQRCISYKNKKIKEHTQQENQHSYNYLPTPTKEEQLYSTRKNTARTLNSSYDLPLIEKTLHNNFNNASPQHSLFKQFKQEKSIIHTQRILVINSKQKQERKTLQRVFEQTQGKRIVTLESQFSNDDEHSNEYSVAESYEFPIQ